MSIRTTVLTSLVVVLGLGLLATGWMARRGMRAFESGFVPRLHAELLQQSISDLRGRGRQLCAVYESRPHTGDASNPESALAPYAPDESNTLVLVYGTDGSLHNPDSIPPGLQSLLQPGAILDLLSNASNGAERSMTADNFQAYLEGRVVVPAVAYVTAYPDEGVVVGIGQTLEQTEVRLDSLSEGAAALVARLGRQGTAVFVAICVITLTLGWAVLHFSFIRPLARVIALTEPDSGKILYRWSELRDYAKRLRAADERVASIRASLEREIDTRYQAEEERDRLKVTMDHALGRMRQELDAEYAGRLRNAQAALMQREARAIHLHLAGPLEELRVAADKGDSASLQSALDRCLAVVRGLVNDEFDLPRAPHATTLQPWLEDVLAQFSERHGIPVRANISNGATVSMDSSSLRQAIEYILENASAASGHARPIEVDTARHEAHVEIRVIDRGPGIDTDARPHMLVPFYTLDEQGSGLGLAITRSVIRQHGGTLKFQSESEKGTVAIISLPLAKIDRSAEAD